MVAQTEEPRYSAFLSLKTHVMECVATGDALDLSWLAEVPTVSEELLSLLRESGDSGERQRAIDEARGTDGKIELRGVRLQGCDLSHLDLFRVDMEQVDLRGVTCHHMRFGGLVDCCLDGVQGAHCDLGVPQRCSFRRAVLAHVETGGRLSGCDFTDAIARFMQINPVLHRHRSSPFNNCFENADLHGLDAAAAYLTGTFFRNARLTDARLSRADLSGCDLQGTDLTGANLVKANLTRANAAGAVLNGCVLAPEQEDMVRTQCPEQSNNLTIVSHAIGPRLQEFMSVLETLPRYRFDWRFLPKGKWKSQKIMITSGERPVDLHGHAFHTRSRGYIRMYPMDEGPNTLPFILLSIATDYADWRIDSRNIAAELPDSPAAERAIELLRPALAELFTIA